MEHWPALLPPGMMLEVDYEDVVADLEGQARRLIAHCGLPWDEACLNFHRTDRRIMTASFCRSANRSIATPLRARDLICTSWVRCSTHSPVTVERGSTPPAEVTKRSLRGLRQTGRVLRSGRAPAPCKSEPQKAKGEAR